MWGAHPASAMVMSLQKNSVPSFLRLMERMVPTLVTTPSTSTSTCAAAQRMLCHHWTVWHTQISHLAVS